MGNSNHRTGYRLRALLSPKKYTVTRPVEGNALYWDDDDTFWWRFKHTLPVEKPEPGKGIEEYFAKQTFDFTVPEGFAPEGEAVLAFGGDILPMPQLQASSIEHIWDDVSDFFLTADIRYANLESPIAKSQKPDFGIFPPLMNSDETVFDLLWQGGRAVNLFSTANNHSLDMGEAGVLETLDFLDARNVPYVGTARSEAQRDDFPVIDVGGVRVAFISYTFSLNCQQNPQGKEYLSNHLRINKPDTDIAPIRRHIDIARNEKSADLVVALLHWSLEFESYPAAHVIEMGHRILESGVDVIVGNHAHGLQPAERYEYKDERSGEAKTGLIYYALGDLFSLHSEGTAPNSRLTALAKIKVQKGAINGKSKTIITDAQLKPLYSYVREDGEKRVVDYRLFDIDELAEGLDNGGSGVALSRVQKREIKRLRALAQRLGGGG
jgi:poly-gamma-glutamate synthesis protein (capsule biosynthesis protein)